MLAVPLTAALAQTDPQTLAEQARERAAANPVQVRPAPYFDLEPVRALSREAIERGKAAMEEEAKALQHPASTPTQVSRGQRSKSDAPAPGAAPLLGRVVVALSSSMPEAMLREYLRQLDGIPESIVILRGFIGGARTVAPTGLWVETVRRREADCLRCPHRAVEIVVDPLTYRLLQIDTVPAVAYLPGVQALKHCDAAELQGSSVVYGATSIESALRRLAQEGVAVPAQLIERFGKRV